LYKPIHQKEGNEICLVDKLEEKERKEEKILDRMLLAQLLESLDKEERQLIYLRYFAEETQSQVGKRMGISQVQVSRMEKRIIESMRKTCNC
jgi:RNA polymerase sporulation-specific sigma factor